jgi:hypothetical protein
MPANRLHSLALIFWTLHSLLCAPSCAQQCPLSVWRHRADDEADPVPTNSEL